MRHDDYTNIGGTGEAFLTTHWSLINEAGSSDEEKNRTLVSLLLSRYWKPVYCYLRRKGFDNEKAKDLTQGFFMKSFWSSTSLKKQMRQKDGFGHYC